VALSSDGKCVVSGSDDESLRVWDLERNENLTTFTCDFAVKMCAWAQHRIVAVDDFGGFHVFAWEE